MDRELSRRARFRRRPRGLRERGPCGFHSRPGRRTAPRLGVDPLPPHSRPMAVLGASLLWFGWLGLTAGAPTRPAVSRPTPWLSPSCRPGPPVFAGRAWSGSTGRATVLGAVSGSLAGLAAITSAAGFVPVWSSLAIGIGGGSLSYVVVQLMPRLSTDDAFDVFAVFGVGGIGASWRRVSSAPRRSIPRPSTVCFPETRLLGIQAIALIAVAAYVLVYTWVILKIVNWTVGLRVTEDEEVEGLDQTQHGEKGYAL